MAVVIVVAASRYPGAGKIHIGIAPALRVKEIGDGITVVAPGIVLVGTVAHIGNVVAHVGGRYDRIELRVGQNARKGAVSHAPGGEGRAIGRVGHRGVQHAGSVGGGADLVVQDVQPGRITGNGRLR